MHPQLLARAISGVSSETTAELFRIRAKIISELVAERVLDFLSNKLFQINPDDVEQTLFYVIRGDIYIC